MFARVAKRLLIGLVSGLVLVALVRANLSAQPSCGNGIIDPGEQCDPPGSITCPPGSPAGAFLPCGANCTCSPGGAFVDHYKCYRLFPNERFTPRTVTLVDQFGPSTATVLKPDRLCNPASKNGEPVNNPLAHLMCYKIQEPRITPRTVLVRNQFGDQMMTVVRSDSLCNPADKNNQPRTTEINHFKCYRARAKGFTKRTVSVVDQFETQTATLVKPKFLCNPVDKNGAGIVDPSNHIACYIIKKGAAFTPQTVTVTDQFAQQMGHALTGDCRKRALLCVPSEKNPGASTTSTSTSSSTTTSSTTTSSTTTSTTTTTLPPCGNGVLDPGEQCDPPGSLTCPPSSAGGAFTACNPDCTCGTTTTTIATTTSTTTTTTSTTTTTLVPCCGPQRITLTSSAGTLQVDNLPAFPFPTGVITKMDTAVSPGPPECRHDVVLPAGGFSVPNFGIPALGYCSMITTLGCETGNGVGAGNLWDGNGAAGLSLTNIFKSADTSDGVCNPAGQPCTTAGAGNNTLGDIDSVATPTPGATGIRSAVDIKVHSTTWLDSVCTPPIGGPDCCPAATYNPADGDLTITQFDFILSPTTGVGTGQFVDKNGDGCKRAGSGFDTAAPGPDGPKSLTGSPAAGPCCVVGQPTTVVSVGVGFSGGAPLYDLGFKSTIPNTVQSCGSVGADTCVVTTDPCLQ